MKKQITVFFILYLGCSGLPSRYSYLENSSNLIRKTDTLKNSEKIEDITHIEFFNPSNPKTIQLYISKFNDQNNLKLTINYYGNEYIDFQKAYLSDNNEIIEFQFDFLEKFNKILKDGTKFEKAELKLNKKEIKQLKNIFKSKFKLSLFGNTKIDYDLQECNYCIELMEYYENSNPIY
ncbi:hypothetical protein ND861_18965 [Leptospira sp. 2 VSF19]|uniref:Lipoprotein n=1 Tax=Leptospira soteropolitanensis TaxID=2950025 RepID=A0AAW5VQI5_9LEPT|nr:hypothetical protein [Leptospira soteropolitanensis]MCW7494748.1 hypothetical protein [Leptospira soteropolitanensis]MCW7502349.1 hypothetical protein [Leptospira soteropolitanensis]MCW7524577.1 hypothetical protein [Leptospira soteropolitanensis]MCW7528447.1 hypothetical protein [Leptospira soteropolitanensis]MCW7532312.1 hypothetical protein [Leptospira soteropolitanensis]